jgi:hypothetical protein
MLEGLGHEERAARLRRSFQKVGRRQHGRRPFRKFGVRLRDLGLVGFGCGIGVLGATVIEGIPDFATTSPPREVYYANCREALLDGVVSIKRGEPGYRPPLDADDDGVACEPYRP